MTDIVKLAQEAGMDGEDFGMQTLEYATRLAVDHAKPGSEYTAFFEGRLEKGKIVQLAVRIVDAPVSE